MAMKKGVNRISVFKEGFKSLPIYLRYGIIFASIDLLIIIIMFFLIDLTEDLGLAALFGLTQLPGFIIWVSLHPLEELYNFKVWITSGTLIFSSIIAIIFWFLVGAFIGWVREKIKK